MDDYIEFNDDIAKYEQDDGFENYIQTTIDPGDTLFIFTLVFCLLSMIALPILVGLGNKRAARRKARREERERENTSKIRTNITVTNVQEVTADECTQAQADEAEDIKSAYADDTASNADDLSIFSQIEKDYLYDDRLTEGDDSDSYCFGIGENQTTDIMSDILQTPFCCVGPDMKAVELPSMSRDKNKEKSHDGAFSAPDSEPIPPKGLQFLKRSNSNADSSGKKKKMSRR